MMIVGTHPVVVSENKRKVSVTVIDSGVDLTVSDLSQFVTETIVMGVNENHYLSVGNSPEVHHIHGTVISLVIRDICPNVSIRSINILDKNCTGDGRILLAAIEYALENPPDILHLSLGTTRLRYWFDLRSMVKKAERAGTMVVAAADNSGKRSFPAFLKGVVGVKTDPKLTDKMNYYYQSGFYYAPCAINSIKGNDEISIPIGGNSTAAAFITGHIAKTIYKKSLRKSIDQGELMRCNEMKKHFKKEAGK